MNLRTHAIPDAFTYSRTLYRFEHLDGTVTTQLKAISPLGLAVGAVGSGGSFAANTYFWKVVAVNGDGNSAGSNEATVAIILNGSANLTWTSNPPDTTGIRVYRGTVTNQETTLVATLTSPVLAYTDLGAAGTAVTAPAVASWANITKTGNGVSAAKSTTGLSSVLPGMQHQMLRAMNEWIAAGLGAGVNVGLAQADANAAGFQLQEV